MAGRAVEQMWGELIQLVFPLAWYIQLNVGRHNQLDMDQPATSVLIWAGPSDEHTHSVFGFLVNLATRHAAAGRAERRQLAADAVDAVEAKAGGLAEETEQLTGESGSIVEHQRHSFARVRAFADRPYFSPGVDIPRSLLVSQLPAALQEPHPVVGHHGLGDALFERPGHGFGRAWSNGGYSRGIGSFLCRESVSTHPLPFYYAAFDAYAGGHR